MIDLYTWKTPNGRKVSIMLEETGLAYETHPVHIGKGEQFKPDFLKVSPNNKIPAIVDRDADGGPVSIFESGAILIYLAEKSGKLLPTAYPDRAKVLEWLAWQVGGLGPMFGQLGHFVWGANETVPYGVKRYSDEAFRLLSVMEKRLGEAAYLGGDYSIADIATYPWVISLFDVTLKKGDMVRPDMPNTERWLANIAARPAVQKGMATPA
ncbi:MAG: glutathione S-transferase N-terminal domain-containing protein [Pseudomonadota bacterium]